MQRLRVLSCRLLGQNVRFYGAQPSSVDFTKLTRKFEPVIIPTPWGHMAGKWWGPLDTQPIVTLHGWQENANAWDPFMNMVPEDMSFLTFDMPGNGRSSHFPGKTWYHESEDVMAIRVLMRHFRWTNPVTFLCHSYSTGHAFVYAACYPQDVKKIIGVDFVKPLGITMKNWTEQGGGKLDKVIEMMDNFKRKEKPLEKHAEDYVKGTMGSISLEAAMYVLERSMERSQTDPNMFRTTRDPRQSIDFYFSFPNEFLMEMAKHIKCEFYSMRATNPLIYESPKLMEQAADILKTSAKKFEMISVDGTHHIHIDHPERIYPHVIRWINS